MAEETPAAADSTVLAVDTPPSSPVLETDDAPDITPSLGAGVLFVLSFVWLAAIMWSCRASFTGVSDDPTVIVAAAAQILPAVVVATLLAGAAAGLAAANRFARPATSTGRTVARRLLIGAAAGAIVGIVVSAVILFTFGFNSAIGVLAATVGGSALLAGLSAGLAATPLAAGIAATLGAFVTGVLLNLFQSRLRSLLGAGKTVASQTDAAHRLLYVSAIVGGVVAAVTAYLYLRRREPDRRWTWFLMAGAFPGLVALFGELVTRLGGASLFSLVAGFSSDDQAVTEYLSGSRILSGITVAFTGGIVATILVGRTMRRPEESALADGPTPDTGDKARLAGSRRGDERFDFDDLDDPPPDDDLPSASDVPEADDEGGMSSRPEIVEQRRTGKPDVAS